MGSGALRARGISEGEDLEMEGEGLEAESSLADKGM